MSRVRPASPSVGRARRDIRQAAGSPVANATYTARLARAAERAARAALRRVRIEEVRRQARLHVSSTGRRRRARATASSQGEDR